MGSFLKFLGIVFVIMAVVGAAVLSAFLRQGLSARREPSAIETFVARRLRRLAIPPTAREAQNPVPATPQVLAEARAHFADHCATCHANDGGGNTSIGRSLYPPAPDMRKAETQDLADGELFYVIHNGIRFTGMPAWGGEDPAEDEDSWKLVHFIRHLPKITAEEITAMKAMNPKGQGDIEEEKEIEQFLRGENDQAPAPPHDDH